MNRRDFLKTLASLGAAILVPPNLALASEEEVDEAWSIAAKAWGLFEVNDYGTLSYANFEEPRTRRDAYWYRRAEDLDAGSIESHWALSESIKNLYRTRLTDRALALWDWTDKPFPDAAIEERAEEHWDRWFQKARGKDRQAINAAIDAWLDDSPDWDNEWEMMYKSGTAQGAAYNYFCGADREVMDELGVVIIEGECPGSSYFAAELRNGVEIANEIAQVNGWEIRFIREGASA
jgi:hypothetical protein